MESLRKGGAGGGHGGTELLAGEDAYVGISEFENYLSQVLNEQEREKLFALAVPDSKETFGSLWSRLGRTHKSNALEVMYCVELIANGIEAILKQNKALYDWIPARAGKSFEQVKNKNLAKLAALREKAKKEFEEELAADEVSVLESYGEIKDECIQTLFSLETLAALGPEEKKAWLDCLGHERALIGVLERLPSDEGGKLVQWLIEQNGLEVIFKQWHSLRDFLEKIKGKAYQDAFREALIERSSASYLQNILSDVGMYQILREFKDNPEDVWRMLDKIGWEHVKGIIQKDVLPLSTIVDVLELLPKKQTTEFINKLGRKFIADQFMSGCLDFKSAMRKHAKMYDYFSIGNDIGSDYVKEKKKAYDAFLLTALVTYQYKREQDEKTYAHFWGSSFGASSKEEKIATAQFFEKVLKGEADRSDLSSYSKHLEHGDLNAIYDCWQKHQSFGGGH